MIGHVRLFLLAALATLFLAKNACAFICTPLKNRTPDSAILAVSFSGTGGMLIPTFNFKKTGYEAPVMARILLPRAQNWGTQDIFTKPTEKAHDFVENYDGAAFLAKQGYVGDPSTRYYGKVIVLACEPGDYFFQVGVPRTDVPLKDLDDVHFKLESGRVTYIGEWRYVRYKGRLYSYPMWVDDNAGRDLEIVRRAGVDVSNPILITPPTPKP
ncbi:MAG TPA: hypothetical protein VG407_17255 [Caulobacteraceae bacterium]|nr:hypothetical protein [Caulobacteraceae bacterium]